MDPSFLATVAGLNIAFTREEKRALKELANALLEVAK
jgi:hypothetical protein